MVGHLRVGHQVDRQARQGNAAQQDDDHADHEHRDRPLNGYSRNAHRFSETAIVTQLPALYAARSLAGGGRSPPGRPLTALELARAVAGPAPRLAAGAARPPGPPAPPSPAMISCRCCAPRRRRRDEPVAFLEAVENLDLLGSLDAERRPARIARAFSSFGTHTPRLLSKSITAFLGATSVFLRSSTVRLMRAYMPGLSR